MDTRNILQRMGIGDVSLERDIPIGERYRRDIQVGDDI